MLINCHTYYSYNFGLMSPKELINCAAEAGYNCIALTDINNTSAVFDFVDLCKNAGIKPVIGVDFKNIGESAETLYIALAKNKLGFTELNRYVSHYLHENKPFPATPPAFENVFIIFPFKAEKKFNAKTRIKSLRENEFIGIKPNDFNKLIRIDESLLKKKAIALYPVTFGNNKDGFYLHCLLRAIYHNTLLKKLAKKDVAEREEFLISQAELLKIYEKHPFLIHNTQSLLDQCEIDFDFKSHKNKKHFTSSIQEDRELLHAKCYEGLLKRYGAENTEAKQRLEMELQVIEKLEFISYFLISWDIVQYSKQKGYFYVGRGSGANSIAAYCLEITDVDPIELDLYFERFLNLHRTSPPDFDMDFSWKDRDDIIQYLFNKYGYENTAMLGSHSTYKFRAVARELGKVYGLPEREIDGFIHTVELDRRTGTTRNPNTLDAYFEKVFRFGMQLMTFPHYLSVHPCGIVISDDPIHSFSATQIPPKGFPITHFDMYVSDKIKLHKLDILSQRGLGHIKDCIEIVAKNHNIEIDIHNIPAFKNDPKLNELLATGNTIGCFYIESPAMRSLLRKLKCRDYLTLVAASSIIRPGVSDSGMQREYIKRSLEPDKYKPIHPKIGEILSETYGVMVYQEDVIKVAHHFAGLTLAESDILRRAMAWKHRIDDGFKQLEDKFFNNCREKEYPEEVTKEIWRQMEAFAGYSFCKAHSASYAVESYQSLYLKAYYPLEFMVAVINNFGGFYNTEFYINEARRWGATVHAPCINRSDYLTIIEGKDIYLGFVHIKNLEQKFAHRFLEERTKNGFYKNFLDICSRVSPEIEQLLILIKVGALRFTGKTKKQLRWEAFLMKSEKENTVSIPPSLFPEAVKTFNIPSITQSFREDAYEEIELLDFPVCSRFKLLTTNFRGEVKARDLVNNVGKKVTMAGFLVTTRTVRTKHSTYMQFASFVDDEGETFEATLFPDVYKKMPIAHKGIYAIMGKVVDDYGVASLEVLTWQQLEISFQGTAEEGADIIELDLFGSRDAQFPLAKAKRQ